MERDSKRLLVGSVLTVGAVMGTWAWRNYEVQGLRLPVSEETGDLQSPFIRKTVAASTTTGYTTYPLADLQEISADLNEINKVVCPTETGLAYLAVKGTDVQIQVCVDFRATRAVSSSFDNTMVNYLEVPLAPDPEAPVFMDWEASISSVDTVTCQAIDRALDGFTKGRIEKLEADYEPDVPIRIIFSANEPASCGA